jgi:uncharacterized protein (DUF1015 family)
MAVFRPFRGCRYVPQVAGRLDDLLCPPYDMIRPALKESLQALSPYNAVHLEGGEQPDPVNPEAGYRQAASRFRQWLESGVLRQEDVPCFYLMRHTYQDQGETKRQLGLFGGILVEEYGQGSVLPHEFTREPAVMDRVALLEASRTQFSPLMTLYRDAEKELASVLEPVSAAPPDLLSGGNPQCSIGEIALWRIANPDLQQRITRFFEGRPIFLADGHHRYEAALRYRRSQPQSVADAAFNYVMMSLTEFDDAGLQLLPYHKVIGGLSAEQLKGLEAGLLELFDDRTIDLAQCGGGQGLGRLVIEAGPGRHVVGLVGPEPDQARLLTLRDGIDWRQWGELAVSEAWVLDEQVIKPLLGDDALARHVDYSHDAARTVDMVSSGAQQLAFLLKPFPMAAFESIVGGGQRLPSKSTFFYPKLPTGLVINRLDGAV